MCQGLTIDGGAGESKDINNLATSSIWFRRFSAGCKARMGQVYKPNLALTTSLIIKLLTMLEKNVRESQDIKEQFDLIVFGSYVVFSYVLSLRGSEGIMINLSTIVKHHKTSTDWIIVGLKGKVKGETSERDHMFYCVNETSSGINVRAWTDLLKTVHEKAGRCGGPGMTNWSGVVLRTSELDDHLHFYLGSLFEEGVEFPAEISSVEDVAERFSVYRSLRRASDTRALEMKVSEADIDVVNRWKAVEASKGSRPGRSMRQHYAEVSHLKLPFLRYTKAM